ncbi:hypothetical protein HPMBJEAJ_00048 [Aeromonas phage avDM6]|nr:hypothetical protein HPMBJEAJ_00048 [Aeromonas phage avDM6]
MIDTIINSQIGFAIITAIYLCAIIYNGVSTYYETRSSSKLETFFMYTMHILVCGLCVKGYMIILSFVDFSKMIG